jgi:hypothetical protein
MSCDSASSAVQPVHLPSPWPHSCSPHFMTARNTQGDTTTTTTTTTTSGTDRQTHRRRTFSWVGFLSFCLSACATSQTGRSPLRRETSHRDRDSNVKRCPALANHGRKHSNGQSNEDAEETLDSDYTNLRLLRRLRGVNTSSPRHGNPPYWHYCC